MIDHNARSDICGLKEYAFVYQDRGRCLAGNSSPWLADDLLLVAQERLTNMAFNIVYRRDGLYLRNVGELIGSRGFCGMPYSAP